MDKWTTSTCEANGINIHYLRTGGDKPPVVLLHGLTANGACWTPLARALEEDYDVIMPDARGHGNSSAPAQGYCYDNLAADVLILIKTLGLATPILIGHSMGGMTAAVVASRNPELLLGLVLADPTFLTLQRQREVYESDVAAQHRQILNKPREDFLAEIRSRYNHRSGKLIELLARARFQTSIHAFEILTPPNPDYVQLTKMIDISTLLIIGDVGGVVSPTVASELAKLNQHLEVAQISEAGHGLPYDQPENFSVVVKAFLQSLIA
jgi:N-formylmaleamate deformylase